MLTESSVLCGCQFRRVEEQDDRSEAIREAMSIEKIVGQTARGTSKKRRRLLESIPADEVGPRDFKKVRLMCARRLNHTRRTETRSGLKEFDAESDFDIIQFDAELMQNFVQGKSSTHLTGSSLTGSSSDYESPDYNRQYYNCNFCRFKTKYKKDCNEHMEREHGWTWGSSTPGQTPLTQFPYVPHGAYSPFPGPTRNHQLSNRQCMTRQGYRDISSENVNTSSGGQISFFNSSSVTFPEQQHSDQHRLGGAGSKRTYAQTEHHGEQPHHSNWSMDVTAGPTSSHMMSRTASFQEQVGQIRTANQRPRTVAHFPSLLEERQESMEGFLAYQRL